MTTTKGQDMKIDEYIAAGGGICGTCASPATATGENEGYSYCCNDRIEYGDEAAQTVRSANCTHARTEVIKTQSCGFDLVWRSHDETVCSDCGEFIGEQA